MNMPWNGWPDDEEDYLAPGSDHPAVARPASPPPPDHGRKLESVPAYTMSKEQLETAIHEGSGVEAVTDARERVTGELVAASGLSVTIRTEEGAEIEVQTHKATVARCLCWECRANRRSAERT